MKELIKKFSLKEKIVVINTFHCQNDMNFDSVIFDIERVSNIGKSLVERMTNFCSEVEGIGKINDMPNEVVNRINLFNFQSRNKKRFRT